MPRQPVYVLLQVLRCEFERNLMRIRTVDDASQSLTGTRAKSQPPASSGMGGRGIEVMLVHYYLLRSVVCHCGVELHAVELESLHCIGVSRRKLLARGESDSGGLVFVGTSMCGIIYDSSSRHVARFNLCSLKHHAKKGHATRIQYTLDARFSGSTRAICPGSACELHWCGHHASSAPSPLV